MTAVLPSYSYSYSVASMPFNGRVWVDLQDIARLLDAVRGIRDDPVNADNVNADWLKTATWHLHRVWNQAAEKAGLPAPPPPDKAWGPFS